MHIVNGLLRFILLAFLFSCTNTPPVNHAHKESIQGKREGLGPLQTLQPQLRAMLERREFLKSLRLMQQEVKLGLSESSLAEEYALALRGGLNYSEELSGKGRFSECGLYARQLLNLYPQNLPALPGVSAEQIRQGMNSCSDELMARGLAAYRAGQMQEAINFWSALLVFNPERTEAKKAIDTCSIQLRNLPPKP
jgi:tetratricopeptide (TPR) repeat protein